MTVRRRLRTATPPGRAGAGCHADVVRRPRTSSRASLRDGDNDGVHAIFVLNLPVPDDRRVWQQAVAVRDAGGSPIVFCPAMRGHRPGHRTVDGIDVRYLRTYEGTGPVGLALEGVWNTAVCLAQIPRLLRRHIGSVQVCNPPDTLFGLLAVCRRLGMRTVYDQHDVVPAMAMTHPGLRRLRRGFEWCERMTVRSADIVLTTSETQRERLRQAGCDDVRLVRSPPVEDEPAVRDRQRATCHLGYLGVIGRADGLDDLLAAVDEARRSDAKIALTIAGDGPFRSQVEGMAADLDLADTVSFAGWLQGRELEDFLESIDAMVVSDPESEYNHMCAMNKTLEAMSRQIPVLMRPLQENRTLTGDHRWITDGWSTTDLAATILDFARTPPVERQTVASALGTRYRTTARWSDHRRRYLDAVMSATGP